MSRAITNPWGAGDICELIVKAQDSGAPKSVMKVLGLMRELLEAVSAIEAEDARKASAQKASDTMRGVTAEPAAE